MDSVVHFEMAYDDPARMSAFYKAAFGWKMKMLGKEMGDYVLAATAPTSADGMLKKPGSINGGFFPRKSDWPSEPSVVISVDNLKKSMESVRSAGGQVLGEPMPIPGIGDFVSIRDTEGNRVGLLQPLPMKKPQPKLAAKKRPAAKKKSKATKSRTTKRSKKR